MDNLRIIILAGGKGERFWPRSTRRKPKQVQKIYSQKTLIEETIIRARFITNKENIFIVCDPSFKQIICKYHPQYKNELNFIIEAIGANTAPAIALATIEIEKLFPDSMYLVMPADHYISQKSIFKKTIQKAIKIAAKKYLVTLGIIPTSPCEEYGYIKTGKDIKRDKITAKKVIHFKEKPNKSIAKKYLAQGDYFWNSGIFIWSAKVILEEFHKHAPEIIKVIKSSKAKKLSSTFKKLPQLSIDFAIMEKSKQILLLPASFHWNDIGSWESLHNLLAKDKSKNVLLSNKGTQLTQRFSKNNIIAVDKGLVALIGIEDVVLVQENDIIFLAKRDKLGEIKNYLNQLTKNPALQKYID